MTVTCGRKHELFTPPPCHQPSRGDVFGGGGVPLSAALTSEGKVELGEGRKGSLLQAIVYLTSKTNYVILGNYAYLL